MKDTSPLNPPKDPVLTYNTLMSSFLTLFCSSSERTVSYVSLQCVMKNRVNSFASSGKAACKTSLSYNDCQSKSFELTQYSETGTANT